MNKKINKDLLLKYLEGDCTKSEIKYIHELFESDSEIRTYFKHAKIIWEIPDKPLPKPNIEKAWQIVKEKTAKEHQGIIRKSPKEKSFNFTQWWFESKILKIAAVLLIFLVSAYLIYQTNAPIKIQLNEIIVENTVTEKITLPDGTRIILDSGSSFQYPKNFNNQKREVTLNGEAYFNVAPDKDKPFIIRTENAKIQVLGTKFNVRAWNQSEKITVAVSEGKVSFKPINNNDPVAEVKISGSQFSEMQKNEYPSLPRETDINIYLAWKNREMYFQNVPLEEVLNQLERWYNLKFELPDNSLAFNRVTIFVENRKIDEILDVIALVNNLQYRKDESKVTFYIGE